MEDKERQRLADRFRYATLYDLYGPLLTDRRREAYELHEAADLSLSEIASHLGTSRQAVSALVQSSRHQLETYENLLGIRARLDKALESLEYLECQIPDENGWREELQKIQAQLRGE